MSLLVLCTVSYGSLFNAKCVRTDDAYTWTTVSPQYNSNLQTALLAGVVSARSYSAETVHLVVVPDGVTLIANHDGSLVRMSDSSAHPCDNWASTDYILRTVVRDVDAVAAVSAAAATSSGHIDTSAGVTNGKRIAVVNMTAPSTPAGVATRLNTPMVYVASWMSVPGVVLHSALVNAPSTVISSALVTALASPGSGTGAPAITTSDQVLALDSVYALYRALHTAATAPGPVLLSLSTLAADLYTHQANTLVAEAIATASRILGWVAGMAAKRGGWNGLVAIYGGETLSDPAVRAVLVASGALQTGLDAGWGGSGGPLARIRTTTPATDPLADGLVRMGAYHLYYQSST